MTLSIGHETLRFALYTPDDLVIYLAVPATATQLVFVLPISVYEEEEQLIVTIKTHIPYTHSEISVGSRTGGIL